MVVNKKTHTYVSQQLEYILKFGTLVRKLDDAFKYLRPDADVRDLKFFTKEFKPIKKEFEKLDPGIFQQQLTNELFKYVKSSHILFKEMLDNGNKISNSIEAHSRTGDVEELRCLHTGALKYLEQSKKMCKLLERLDKAYARLNKKVNKLVRTVI